jgi:hypothetical protein
MTNKKLSIKSFVDLTNPAILELLSANGHTFVQQIGLDVIRGVVLDILSGRNLRDSTETLTRRRIAILNLAMLDLFLKGSTLSEDFTAQLPIIAAEILSRKRLPKTEKWIAQWMLGLTDKAFQNVLRDDPRALASYRDQYIRTCIESITTYAQAHGELSGYLSIGTDVKAHINWLGMTYLLNAIGAQALSIRGSEKSTYGKLFERLVLGSLLHILGFKYILPPPQEFDRVFWLSSRGEKRESDATLLYRLGKGVRFDIGFIGRGNPEISLDKVSRFERELTLGRATYYMATIILVDRIGANSRIERLAKDFGGIIIQMSAGYWPKQVAKVLNQTLGFQHELLDMRESQIEAYLQRAISETPLESFISSEIASAS